MKTAVEEIAKLISQIRGRMKGGTFRPFIKTVHFSKFKNFRNGESINFQFPLAAVVGQNGTCKTALLHALSGAPKNNSPGNWWFETEVDPIDTDQTGRNLATEQKAAFWYVYIDEDGTERRALKTRIRRDSDPDYWEPSRPVEAYGMEGRDRRDPPVRMPSHYLNFKTQMNAFDRCFYFAGSNQRLLKGIEGSRRWQKLMAGTKENRRRTPRIQDYLRIRSKQLKKALVDGVEVKIGLQRMHKKRVVLNAKELETIGQIIGRRYAFGAIIEHRFYESWGTSVYFGSGDLKYSEAFAGSGESAVARMVHAVNSAKDGSLFLLDEPETSLHPGAQVEVVKFLLQKALEKHLQIVVSTHSPNIVRHLPQEAIHVLSIDPENTIRIADCIPPEEAFFQLGHPIDHAIQVVVEDVLSRQLLEQVALTENPALAARFNFTFGPGGDSAMKQNAAVYMKNNGNRVFFVFDGDKKDECGPIPKNSITIESTVKEIDQLILDSLREKISFDQDSNMTEARKRDIRLSYIEFVNSRFRYLPFDVPEAALWDMDAAKLIAAAAGIQPHRVEELQDFPPKLQFARLADLVAPGAKATSQDINCLQRVLVSRFCAAKGDVYQSLVRLLKDIADNA
jgi:predicted ATPase